MNLYLDIDGVLLGKDAPSSPQVILARHARQFIEFAFGIEGAFSDEATKDPYGCLIRYSCHKTKNSILEPDKPKVPQTERRCEMQKFMRQVEAKVTTMLQGFGELKLYQWRAGDGDVLYGSMGGDHGNVSLTVFDQGTDLADRANPQLHARVSFKVANKVSAVEKSAFRDIPEERWGRLLGLPHMRLDRDCEVVYDHPIESASPDSADQMAALVCRFLLTFRQFTANAP